MDLLNLTDPWSPLGSATSPHFFSSAGTASTSSHHHHQPAQTPAAWLPSCALSQYPSLVPPAPSYTFPPVPSADTSPSHRSLPPYALTSSKQLSDMIHVTSAVSGLSGSKEPWTSLTPPWEVHHEVHVHVFNDCYIEVRRNNSIIWFVLFIVLLSCSSVEVFVLQRHDML